MTANELAALLSAVAALGTVYNGWNIRRVEKNSNSMKDELVAEVRMSALAKGRKQEKDDPTSGVEGSG